MRYHQLAAAMSAVSKRRTPNTRLDRFLSTNGIKHARLAREAGCSRQHLYRIRTGAMEPTRVLIRALRLAARNLLQRQVRPEELFDLSRVRRARAREIEGRRKRRIGCEMLSIRPCR